eukprot:gene20634-biopygen19126
MRPYRRRATDARREKWTCVFVSEAACWKSRGCFAVQTKMHTYKHMHTCTRTYTMRRAPRPSRPPPPSRKCWKSRGCFAAVEESQDRAPACDSVSRRPFI